MTAFRYEPDAVFEPASAGTRVRLATTAALVVGALIPLVELIVMLNTRRPPYWLPHFLPHWPALLAAGVAPAVLVVVWLVSRLQRYRLTNGEVRVELRLRTVRFPLAGLVSAVPDRTALRGARKIAGNDGLGAVTGRFRSRQLGRFRAYLTDVEHAVVLRWPDRCLVISPQHHSLFVEAVRRRAGLPR